MTRIEIGDIVCFYDTFEKLKKDGQVVNISNDECEVYVFNEATIYFVKKHLVRKL